MVQLSLIIVRQIQPEVNDRLSLKAVSAEPANQAVLSAHASVLFLARCIIYKPRLEIMKRRFLLREVIKLLAVGERTL